MITDMMLTNVEVSGFIAAYPSRRTRSSFILLTEEHMLLFFKHRDTQKDVFYVGSLSKL